MIETVNSLGTVAVIGAGIMGRGIAFAAVLAGASVTLTDSDGTQLDAARKEIERDLHEAAQLDKLSMKDVKSAIASLRLTIDTADACDDARLVIEAVVERLEVKRVVLRVAEAACGPETIIATNTSSMSVTEILSSLRDPSRGLGMHFFNPVPKMKLVEIVQALQTSNAAIETAVEMAKAMGKETVLVKDMPGFATSRINALIGNEAMRMLEEGVASANDIDSAIKMGLNHPMGPLELGDLVGWDTRLDILEYLSSRLGSRFRPTNIHRQLVAAGHYGRKTSRGVFTYDSSGRPI